MLQWLWIFVLLWNVVTLLTYGWDKLRAKKQQRRVPERVLLFQLFLCGWPGAWLAMSWFRHKTIKQPFRRLAIVWTIVNPIWLLIWWTAQELLTAA